MLKLLCLAKNFSKGNESYKNLISKRNKYSASKTKIPTFSSSKKELHKLANDSTGKKKSRKKSAKKSPEEKKMNINSYQYIHQKSLNYVNYINAPEVKNINNSIIKTNSKEKDKIKFVSSICLNKNKKNVNKRKSIDDRNLPLKNLTTDKKIKEIKIKSNFSLSQINLFVNKSNKNIDLPNQKTSRNNHSMIAVSSLDKNNGNIFDDNSDISSEKNKTLFKSMCNGVYHRKKLKIYHSSSMEKKPKIKKEIQSIEINFRQKFPKPRINKFQSYITPQNLYQNKKEKIIKIQRHFRQFLLRKFKRTLNDKIKKGLICVNKFIKKKMFFWLKQFAFEKKNDIFYVKESQMELLNVLKRKNIYSMLDLKKFIVCSIKNNKLEMF